MDVMSLSIIVSVVPVVVIQLQVASAGMQCCLRISPSGRFFVRRDFIRGLELVVFGTASNVEENFVSGAGSVFGLSDSSCSFISF